VAGPFLPVRGRRDVDFDPRTGSPNVTTLPATETPPTRPYWFLPTVNDYWWIGTNYNMLGRTVQFDLTTASYNSADKTCTNVACHLSEGNDLYLNGTGSGRFLTLQWGRTYYQSTDPRLGTNTCSACHRMGLP
jgi:hypothetical protein